VSPFDEDYHLSNSTAMDLLDLIRSEVTMFRAALALCLTLPATRGFSADPNVVDVTTWRWNVSAILRAQHDDEINSPSKDARLSKGSFGQQYERYLPNGVRDTASKGLGR
jgi:hypothetical protein